MGQIRSFNWVRLVLLNSLLVFAVGAGADVHRVDHHDDADGSLDGGPREGGGRDNSDHDGDFDNGRDDDFDNGRDDDFDRDGRGGHDGGDRSGGGGRDGRHGGGGRPDPNPYDPNQPQYPETPCERDPRYCGGNGGGNNDDGGWGNNETQRSIYVNQVFQQQYVDLNYLAGGVIGNMRGYGLTGIDVEVLNSWGSSTLRLIVNNQQVDAQNVYGRYVQLNSYQPINLNYGNRVNIGVQGRVHIGQIVLHFQPTRRR